MDKYLVTRNFTQATFIENVEFDRNNLWNCCLSNTKTRTILTFILIIQHQKLNVLPYLLYCLLGDISFSSSVKMHIGKAPAKSLLMFF